MAQGRSDVTESRKVGDAELVTVGIDVSDRYSHLCVLGGEGEIVREERVRTTTAALTPALDRVSGARVVMEVGPRSPWLSRVFSELGHDVIGANPRQVRLIAPTGSAEPAAARQEPGPDRVRVMTGRDRPCCCPPPRR